MWIVRLSPAVVGGLLAAIGLYLAGLFVGLDQPPMGAVQHSCQNENRSFPEVGTAITPVFTVISV